MNRQQTGNSNATASGRTFGGPSNNANIPYANSNTSKKEQSKKSYTEDENKENISKKESIAVDKKWDDLDLEDMDDPLMVAEYIKDIVEYMRKLEVITN
jgi:hypothetical protein